MLDDFESYLVRRAVCGYNQKAYNRLFLVWLSRLRDGKVSPARESVRELLSESTAETAIWPDDNEFRAQLIGDPTYKALGPRRTQMVLEAIEYANDRRFAEQVVIKSRLTVEHVLPQGGNSADSLEIRRNETADDALARRLLLTQNIGNLIGDSVIQLITQQQQVQDQAPRDSQAECLGAEYFTSKMPRPGATRRLRDAPRNWLRRRSGSGRGPIGKSGRAILSETLS